MPTPEQLDRLANPKIEEGSPLHQLVTAHRQKPAPDSREWWQEVAQGLGIKIHTLKADADRLRAALRTKIAEIEQRADSASFKDAPGGSYVVTQSAVTDWLEELKDALASSEVGGIAPQETTKDDHAR